jgi:HPt (histidine-containing phosphotransfer) domain-containing protein
MDFDNSLINLDKLKSFWGEDIQLQKEMLNIYINDVPEYLTSLKKAIEEKNFKAVYLHAHQIKGVSLAMAIEVIPNHCLQIEILAQNSSLEGVNDLVIAIETILKKLKTFVI